MPGVGEHIVRSFQMILGNCRLFLPLMIIGALVLVLTVGVTDLFSETAGVFGIVVGLVIWMTTIYLVRQIMAKHKVKLRDGLYNAMGPLISTFVIFAIAVVECVPIMVFVMAYAAAMETGFLTMPFYALLFWGFAGIMFTTSFYLLSTTLIALIAVTAPGVYPLRAMIMATRLMQGRKIRFVLRLVALVMVLAVIWAAVLLPLSALQLSAKMLSVAIIVVACFSVEYMAVYLYIYYRKLLESKD